MTACDSTDFNYQPASFSKESDALARAWSVGIGLQKVDGLETSPYLRHVALETVEGRMEMGDVSNALKTYYRRRDSSLIVSGDRAQEADFVSHRIAELLASRAFFFAPEILFSIHEYLFQDLDAAVYCPGEIKREALVKQETILNGDSVMYADPRFVKSGLAYLFGKEDGYVYGAKFTDEGITHLSDFVSHVWQVHPFCEGNTRAIAVFTELYLDYLGFDASNDPFEQHARYFRDALVRANYRNAKAGVMPDTGFLAKFFENMLSGSTHELKSRDLICQPLFDDPTLLRNMPLSAALTKGSD